MVHALNPTTSQADLCRQGYIVRTCLKGKKTNKTTKFSILWDKTVTLHQKFQN